MKQFHPGDLVCFSMKPEMMLGRMGYQVGIVVRSFERSSPERAPYEWCICYRTWSCGTLKHQTHDEHTMELVQRIENDDLCAR